MITGRNVELKEVVKKREFKISDLVVPMLSIMIFIIMTVFVYMPKIAEIVTMRNDISNFEAKQVQIVNSTAQAELVDQSEMTNDYIMLAKLIPTRLEVGEFAYYIDELAQKKNLKLDGLRASSEDKDIGNNVHSVTGPLKYSGSYSNIVSFLDELQNSAPYIISIGNIKMASSDGSTSNWSLEINVESYYMDESVSKTTSEDYYVTFNNYQNNSLIDELRDRAEKFE